MKYAKAISTYFFIQAAGGLAWWCLLLLDPKSRSLFKVQDAPDSTLLAFWLADIGLFVVGSLLCGIAIWRAWKIASPVLWFTAGATAYAALYCLALTLMTGDGLWGAILMVPAMVVTVALAFGVASARVETPNLES